MKILFVWTGVTSYMADCWRALQRQSGIELKVVVEQVASGSDFNAAHVLRDLDCVLTTADGFDVSSLRAFRPDVVFAVGWHSRIVRAVVSEPDWKDIPKICCFDLPWRWSLRCFAAKFVLGAFLRRYSAAYVPGRACERYAKWLGFRKVYKGLFSIDVSRFGTGAAADRKGFLYVGRFSEEKRLDLIFAAYARYRESGGSWTLDLYGSGNAIPDLPSAADGLSVHPFVQADEVPRLYAGHACLLLASAFDPWPLVALEARAAGCEVIQSDRCGNRLELDTRVVRYGDAGAMARKMLEVERAGCAGTPGRVENWGCEAWTKRTIGICEEVR